MFSPKCPYCKGKNLYLKRTSPLIFMVVKDCEKKVKYLKEQGMSIEKIKKFFKM